MVCPLAFGDLVFGEEAFEFVGGHLHIGADEERLDALFLEELGAFGGLCETSDTARTPCCPKVKNGDLALEGGLPCFGFLEINKDKARCFCAFGDRGFGLVEHAKRDKRQQDKDQEVEHGSRRIAALWSLWRRCAVAAVFARSAGRFVGFIVGQGAGLFG